MQSKQLRAAWIRRIWRQLRKDFGDKCTKCDMAEKGDPKNPTLEFAHLKPTKLNGRGRGSLHRYYDIRKNPKSYALMCTACHFKFDYGITNKEDPGF